MNIGIDARLLNDRMTGVGRYLLNILKYLPEYDRINKYFLYIYEGVKFNDPYFNYTRIPRSKLPRQIYEHYWLNFILPELMNEQNIDLFFTPYVLVPMRRGKQKNVIVIHDSITKSCKESYTYHYRKYMNTLIPRAVNRSEKVVTVSASAKKDIINNFNVPPDKIDFMHLWTDDKYHPRNLSEDEKRQVRNKYNLPAKFVLYVGVIEERKNIQGIIKISDILHSRGEGTKFVLIGKEGFNFQNHILEINKRKDRFIYHKWVDEQSLPLIYNMASVFLFPSTYEGFGLPPLEAMKSGVPVVTSNNTSLPEVVGEGGLLYDSSDYNGFADIISRLLNDEQFHSLMRLKGLEQAKKFTPENQMPKLLEIFNNVLNS
jgi:glycosyltransferase involved in cell wall biosynthesis